MDNAASTALGASSFASPKNSAKNPAKNPAMRPARLALAAALYAASIAVLAVALFAPPSFAVFAAWRASVAADADGMDNAARALASSKVAAYRDAALYYAARSDALRPPRSGFTAAAAASRREAMRENLAASSRDAAEPFSPNHFLHLDLPHQDMQMLLAYADFYAKKYEQAMGTYWDVLVRHPHNRAALRGYEMALFFYNYEKTQPARSYDEDARKNAAGLARSAPESLFKLEYGNTYYMLEKLNRNSQLPPY